MATITKADVLSQVRQRTGRTNLSAADIKAELESILIDLSNRAPWPVLQTVTAKGLSENTESVALPSLFRTMTAVYDANGDKLEKRPYGWIKAMRGADDTAGTPRYYAIHGSNVYIYPKASASGTLYLDYAQMCTDEDAILFETDFAEAVYEGTCWKVEESYGMMGKVETTTFFKGTYEEQVGVLLNKYKGRMEEE